MPRGFWRGASPFDVTTSPDEACSLLGKLEVRVNLVSRQHIVIDSRFVDATVISILGARRIIADPKVELATAGRPCLCIRDGIRQLTVQVERGSSGRVKSDSNVMPSAVLYRHSTRLNSSHTCISHAVFCLT